MTLPHLSAQRLRQLTNEDFQVMSAEVCADLCRGGKPNHLLSETKVLLNDVDKLKKPCLFTVESVVDVSGESLAMTFNPRQQTRAK